MVLTFIQAILLFAILQIAVLLLLLLKTSRIDASKGFALGMRVAKTLSLASCLLAVATFTFTWLLPGFRESIPYYVMLFALTALILMDVFARNGGPISAGFFSIVFWQLSIYMGLMPLVDISVGEGTGMDRALAFNDRWDFSWAHNPSYNPLPTMAFLRVTLSRILGLPWYSSSSAFFLSLALWIAYNLTVYMLTYVITRDRIASFISMMFVTVTPLTPIHQHPYQWSSNLMWIAALAVLFKSILQGVQPRISDLTTIVLLSAGAFLAHATGLALPIALALAWLTLTLMKKVKKVISRVVVVEESTPTVLKVLSTALTLSTIVFIVRVLLPAGTFEYIFPILQGVVTSLVDILKEAFSPAPPTMEGVHIPLYERAGVSPIQAYSWTLGVSAAMAWIAYRVIRERRLTFIELFLIAPTIVVGYVFLAYGIFKASGAHFINTRSYVFIPLLYPLASLTMSRIARQSRRFSPLVILLIALAATIASHDPNVSPIQYVATRGSKPLTLTPSDIAKSHIAVQLIDQGYIFTDAKALYVVSYEAFQKTIVYTARGLVSEVILSSKFSETTQLYAFIHNIVLPKLVTLNIPLHNMSILLNFGDDSVGFYG